VTSADSDTLLVTASLANTCRRWVFTVCGDMCNRLATSQALLGEHERSVGNTETVSQSQRRLGSLDQLPRSVVEGQRGQQAQPQTRVDVGAMAAIKHGSRSCRSLSRLSVAAAEAHGLGARSDVVAGRLMCCRARYDVTTIGRYMPFW